MTASRTPTASPRKTLMSRFTALLGGSSDSRPANKHRARLGVEVLEDRRTPSTASLSGGVLKINGTSGNDTIVVYQANGLIEAVDGNNTVITVRGQATVNASEIRKVVVNARGGNDQVRLDGPYNGGNLPLLVPAVVHGGSGNDVIVGGQGADRLYGDRGDDLLYGLGGEDVFVGGAGKDTYGDFYNPNQPAIGGVSPGDFKSLSHDSRAIMSTLSKMIRKDPGALNQRVAYLGRGNDGVDYYQVAVFGLNQAGQLYQSIQTVAFNGFWDDTEVMPKTDGEFWALLVCRAVKQQGQQDGQDYHHAAYVKAVLTGQTV